MPTNPISTGAIDVTPIVLTASDTLYPDDRLGTLARINSLPPGKSVDDIFFFNINSEYFRRVIDGPMSASYCGVYPDGTDQTSNFSAAFSAGVKTIVFDNPDGGTYIINGTLSVPAGVTFKFYQGNKLSGAGTINGGIIDAAYMQHIFDTSLTVNPESTIGEKFSVRWFGALGNNSHNDAPEIQATIDLVIRNNEAFKTVLFPNGYYKISQPLIAYRWDGINYQFHTIYLEGDGTFWPRSGIGPTINATFRDTFAIGIQRGKGCKIKGLHITGGFAPPVTGTGYEFYSCSFDNFVDGISRDKTYSPYCGIVIDPFSSQATVPLNPQTGLPIASEADYFYPGYETWYRGTGGSGGSTGTEIEDVVVTKFVIGICSTPNAVTRNAELTLISKYQFSEMKLAIAGCQDQEKMNKVQFAAGWSNIHTVFATSFYGAGSPGNWHIEELNLAGNVNRLIYNNQSGYFPTYIKKVFAESLGTFGTINSQVGAEVDSCEVSFQYPDVSKMVQHNIDSTGVKFSNCCFRYYGTAIPISIKGRSTYENVTFNATPFVAPEMLGQVGTATFLNCTANTYRLGVANTLSQITNHASFVNASPYAPLGSFKTYSPIGYDSAGRIGYIFEGDQVAISVGLGTFTISVSGVDRKFVINLSLSNLFRVSLNAVVAATIGGLYQPVGFITDINTSTGDVTISYAAKQLVNGDYYLQVDHPLTCGTPFIGDVTVSTKTITNVKIADGMESTLLGSWIKSPVHVTDSYTPYVRITDWDAGTRTLTVSANAYYTVKATFFCNEGTQYHRYQNANTAISATRLLQKGSEFSMVNAFGRNGVMQQYVIIESGYLDPTAVSDTRKAYFVPKDVFEYTANPEGAVYFPAGSNVRNINTGEVYTKTTTDSGAYNGGATGWVKQRQQLFGAITSNTSVLIPAGDVVGKIVITSTTTQSGLLLGITPGGSELGTVSFTGAANAGIAVTAAVLGTGSNYIYITNIAGTANYRIILE